jgi:hypothetical protein
MALGLRLKNRKRLDKLGMLANGVKKQDTNKTMIIKSTMISNISIPLGN